MWRLEARHIGCRNDESRRGKCNQRGFLTTDPRNPGTRVVDSTALWSIGRINYISGVYIYRVSFH